MLCVCVTAWQFMETVSWVRFVPVSPDPGAVNRQVRQGGTVLVLHGEEEDWLGNRGPGWDTPRVGNREGSASARDISRRMKPLRSSCVLLGGKKKIGNKIFRNC